VIAHFGRHCLHKHFFEGVHGLVGSVANGGRGIYLRAEIQIVTHQEFRPVSPLDSSDRTKGHHLIASIADKELAEVIEIGPVRPFGLNVNLPIASETIEVVDKSASHERLDGFIDIADGNPLLKRSFKVDSDVKLWNMRQERGVDLGELRSFTGGGNEGVDIVRQELCIAA